MKIPSAAVSLLCLQRTHYHDRIVELYRQELSATYKAIRPWLPSQANCICDIGCGLSGIDIFLSQHYQNKSKLLLIDGDTIEDKRKIGWNENAADFGFYNSRELAEQILTGNGVPQENIEFSDARGGWQAGRSAEIIISLYSWGFHYPIKTYLAAVQAMAAPEAIIIADIRKGTRGAQELAEYFGPGRPIYLGKSMTRFVFGGKKQ